jgi:hypothetical protein
MESCRQIFKDQNHQLASQLELENDNLLGKCFQWNTIHPLVLYLKYTHLHQYGHLSSVPMQFYQFELQLPNFC